MLRLIALAAAGLATLTIGAAQARAASECPPTLAARW
jgi:hypothetical protein